VSAHRHVIWADRPNDHLLESMVRLHNTWFCVAARHNNYVDVRHLGETWMTCINKHVHSTREAVSVFDNPTPRKQNKRSCGMWSFQSRVGEVTEDWWSDTDRRNRSTLWFSLKIQSVPLSKPSVSVIKTSELMLYREIIAVCSEIHTKHTNTPCGQNVEFVNAEPCGVSM
jgi:hypothetical protein